MGVGDQLKVVVFLEVLVGCRHIWHGIGGGGLKFNFVTRNDIEKVFPTFCP